MTSNPLCTQYRRGHQHRRAIFKYHHIVDLAIALYLGYTNHLFDVLPGR